MRRRIMPRLLKKDWALLKPLKNFIIDGFHTLWCEALAGTVIVLALMPLV